MNIIKIGLLGVLGAMLALQFKTVKPEISFYIGTAVSIVIFAYAVDGLWEVLGRMQVLRQYLEQKGGYYSVIFKAVGITYICEFCASVCKDAGYQAVAGQIEIFGKLTVLFLGLPILTAVIENINVMVR